MLVNNIDEYKKKINKRRKTVSKPWHSCIFIQDYNVHDGMRICKYRNMTFIRRFVCIAYV